ncbi:MAG: phosphoribosylanthranilate isomerase [Candidatus Omnitrophota bacterium]
MVKVKICGITSFEDADKACEYGADFLGFIFVKGTPRCIDPFEASDIIQKLKERFDHVGMVGLFKDEDIVKVREVVSSCNLDHVQLHGGELPGYCRELKAVTGVKIIKAFKVDGDILSHGSHRISDYADADYFVFDTYHPLVAGGTGVQFDWDALSGLNDDIRGRSFVAGGLAPDNVAEAVRTVKPYGVDVSSGVEESPGKKDDKLLKEFIENAKKV